MKNLFLKTTIKILLCSIVFLSCTRDMDLVTEDFTTTKGLQKSTQRYTAEIPIGGNSWVISDVKNNVIFDHGLHNWIALEDVIRTYFHVNNTGNVKLGLTIKVPSGVSKIRVSLAGQSKEIVVSNTGYQNIDVGTFSITKKGYNYVDIQGIEKTGVYIGDVNTILLDSDTIQDIFFVKDDFHFGRRGPSVHLGYDLPKNKEFKIFHSEVTVPSGNDIVGSYYMVNGFKEGYFGMQVNSKNERRILFSVWSPYTTDDPNSIPEDYKIKLLEKGEGVVTGKFGNEGSGGKSYKVFNWKTEVTYKFRLEGKPNSINNTTDYTAKFFDPETRVWYLIASFRRPYTTTYLQNFYSFLENFDTSTGNISRKVSLSNQWVQDTNDQWHRINKAKFTADATAREKSRLDYRGGTIGNAFFLENCGFFDDNVSLDQYFSVQ
ncbi:DUF3472 domain-containing protein [Aquimarina longa]|uniref:DUF3472 domain-containing protein n=1 Tax=Aquimarina longa TaxID=1080221 RepID=UPI00130EB962|nr:DUF3472 domain-containing protein [Aquimarina longa]